MSARPLSHDPSIVPGGIVPRRRTPTRRRGPGPGIRTPRPGLHAMLLAALLAPLLSPAPASSQETATVTGTVTDLAARPVAGARVRLLELSRTARTDDGGRYRLEEVPPGAYLLEARGPTGTRALERVRPVAGEELVVDLVLSPVFDSQDLLVTARPGPARRSELYQASGVVTRRTLDRRPAPTLGDALDGLPGVVSATFGPGASRPVIRGLGGSRVRVLQDGVGVGDASTTSPDHAVGAEALAADRIEVLRGPATLLYGSSAVGGVVNLIDGRIPRELPDRALSGTVRGLAGTVSDETTGDLRLTGRVGRFAWHASGLRRDTEDFDIPGPAELEPPGTHEEGEHGAGEAGQGTDPDPDHGATETGGERLENSDVRTTRGALGVSYVGERGYVGISWSGHDSRYGVPGHAHGDEEHGDGHGDAAVRAAPDADDGAGGIAGVEGHGEEQVDIDLQQRRVDLAGAWDFDGSLLRGIRARFGVADYRHFELEGPEVGTRFENDQWEARLEARHGVGDALSGALGVQLGNRDLRATGEEAFVPPAVSRSLGIFLFEELAAGPLTYQLGARWERQDARNELTGREVDHQGVSVSAGVNWSAAAPLTLTASGSRSVKLPTSEELFADGPHLATRSFEVGNPGLDAEVAWTGEVGALLSAGRLTAELHWFASRFEGFVYQAFTDREEDGLPVRPFTQDDALFTGLEAGAGVDLLREARRRLSVDVSGDWVRGELLDADAPLPRIPPFRLGGGAGYEDPAWSVRTALRRITGQDRVAAFETPTAGYTMLDASVSRRFRLRGLTHELILSGTNLTNEVARSHVSFLKDVAPLPGREVRLSYRLSF